MRGKSIALITAALGLMGLSGLALAQKTSIEAIEEYREMLQDGNPADLFEAKGEDLWKKKRGPKNASLEGCDLGLGPGVVKGAFVELPRWFADTGKVQDLESRLLTCMSALQGIDPKVIIDDLKRESANRAKAAKDAPQFDMFADFNGLPDAEAATEFYQHDQHWSNRMISGDRP